MNYVVETEVACPYCGESFPLSIDTSQGDQTLVEDCTVCCQPMSVSAECEPGEVVALVIDRP